MCTNSDIIGFLALNSKMECTIYFYPKTKKLYHLVAYMKILYHHYKIQQKYNTLIISKFNSNLTILEQMVQRE